MSVVVLAVACACAVWLPQQSALVRRIPADIKQQILAGYHGDIDGPTWQAYREDIDGASFAVVSWTSPYSPNVTNYDIYRIVRSDGKPTMRGISHRWRGGSFEASGSYLLTSGPSMDQRPYEHFLGGTAFDKRTARIVASTRDGRTADAVFFDGFWWLDAPMNPADYVSDKWVTASAYDAAGNLISTCTPEYGIIPCEDKSSSGK